MGPLDTETLVFIGKLNFYRSNFELRVIVLRKRFYILFVARDAEGQLRKIPIPIHYLYVFLAGALIGMSTITGMAGSYARMLWKVASFNQLRTEKTALQTKYSQLEQVTHEKDIQVASLGSIANEVSVIYGLKPKQKFLAEPDRHRADIRSHRRRFARPAKYQAAHVTGFPSAHSPAGQSTLPS